MLSGCSEPRAGSARKNPAPVPSTTVSPAPPPVDPIVQYADDRLASMTLRERVASLFMLHYPGTSVGPIRSFVKKYQPGGLILMGDNVPADPSKLATLIGKLSPDTGLPLLTGIDQEGGIVRRIPTDAAASAATLKNLAPSAARAAFSSRGSLLNKLGVSINFGIIADETSNPASFIYSRVLGTSPKAAADRVAAAVKGEGSKVMSTLKHFPGHGISVADSHSSIPTTDLSYSKWLATHAVPFEAGIRAGAPVVMFGHLQFNAIDRQPATLSTKWHDILRNELGFTGIAITDDMLMLQRSGNAKYSSASKNAIAAIAAGNTMLLYVLPAHPEDVGFRPDRVIDAVVAAVEDGSLPESTVDAAAHQLLEVRRGLSGQTGAYVHCDTACRRLVH
jgi:beta-N-acetylhexosaminidase